MAIRCKDCIYYREREDEVWMCTCRERVVQVYKSPGSIALFDERAREEEFGYWFLLPTDLEVQDCKYYAAALPGSLPQAKLIHKPLNWQQYKEVNRGSVL